MPDARDDGGAAFPFEDYHQTAGEHGPCSGMTLRDYFAAKAMQGLLTNPYWDDATYAKITREAYTAADAMLAARKEPRHAE